MRRNIAFSIVELLVVIGIVSVIAAMLLPSLEQSLMAARTARCAGNLRQQGNPQRLRLGPGAHGLTHGTLWWESTPAGQRLLHVRHRA